MASSVKIITMKCIFSINTEVWNINITFTYINPSHIKYQPQVLGDTLIETQYNINIYCFCLIYTQVDNSASEQRVSSLEFDKTDSEGAAIQSVVEVIIPSVVGNGEMPSIGIEHQSENPPFAAPRWQQCAENFTPEDSLLADLVAQMGGLDIVSEVSLTKTEQESIKKL